MAQTHVTALLAVAFSAASLLALPKASAITPLGSWQNGIATNYGGPADGMNPGSPSFGTSVGSCGYGLMDKGKWPYWSVGALATSNQFYSAGPLSGCGQCFQVECLSTVDESKGTCNSDPNLRSVTIMISDECPECASNQIDLQALTFAKMAPMIVGRINMRYRRVECTPPADMKLSILDNRGAGGWIRLSVQETGGRGAVQAIQIRGSGSGSDNWTPMQNVWGAEWESSSQPAGSISFRILPDQGGEHEMGPLIRQPRQPSGLQVTAFNVLNGSQTGLVPTRVQFTMHDQPSTGPQQGAASQAQVQAFSGPSDSSSDNSSTSTGNNDGGGRSSSASSSVDGGNSSGGGGDSSSNSFPPSSGSPTSSDGSQQSSSGEGDTPLASDSAAVDAPEPGDARRLLRRLSRRLLHVRSRVLAVET